MGCFLIDIIRSPGGGDADERNRNDEINQQLKHDAKKFRKTINILLLGTTEAGKSTVFKQMKLLHCDGFSEAEKLDKIPLIRKNVHESIYTLVKQAIQFDMKFDSDGSVQSANYILRMGTETPQAFTTEDYVYRVQSLWLDGGIQKCYRRANEFNLVDCAK